MGSPANRRGFLLSRCSPAAPGRDEPRVLLPIAPRLDYTSRLPRPIANTLSLLRSVLILTPLIWLYTIVLGALSLLASFFDRDGSLQHAFARLWSRMILATTMTPVTVTGLENIPRGKSVVYAVNHGSALDIPTLYANLPGQFRILAKKELFRYPFMGWHLKRSGQIAIDRDDGPPPNGDPNRPANGAAPAMRRTVETLKRTVDTLRSGMPLLIFPEGGRCLDGHLQPFLGGAFYAAIRAGVDVVPMALVGTFEALRMNSFHIHPRPLQLVIGPPIPTTGYSVRERDALAARVRSVIADLYYQRASLPRPAQAAPVASSQTTPLEH